MSDTSVFLLHAAIAAAVAMAVLFLPVRMHGRRALTMVVVAACLALSVAWLAAVSLVPLVPPSVAGVLRQSIAFTVQLGPWLVGAAVVATVEAVRQRAGDRRMEGLLSVGLAIYVSLNFLGFEVGKAWHDAEMRQFFQASGLPVWSMYAVMGVETAAALALLVPRLRLAAAGVLALVMVGAIATHLRNGDPFGDSLDALRMLLVLGCVLMLARSRRRAGPAAWTSRPGGTFASL